VGTHYDLAIIGSGSGNSLLSEDLSDWRVALFEESTFGGTCLNKGCIPTKMFAYPADLAHEAAHASRLGVDTSFSGADWPAIRDRIFRRIDPISVAGRNFRVAHISLFESHVRFVDAHTLRTDAGDMVTASQIVIASGSRPVLPPVEGLQSVPFHTSDTVMRIDALPRRLLIIGGGFVSAEFAHVFSAFGTEVTVVNRSDALLRQEDADVSARFTDVVRSRWDVRLECEVSRVTSYDGGVRAELTDDTVVDADLLLVATGRRPNSDLLGLDRAGVKVDEAGLVVVDTRQRTTVPGVWALGDVCNAYQLKHVSNHEARVVRYNVLHPDDPMRADHRFVPSAVFSYPQVASVGLTEQDAHAQGLRYVTARQSYGDTAYGWAMEETAGFVKLLADPDTGLLLGGHVIGPDAANLIQPLVQAMSFGQTAHDVARGQYWIHPAMMEVIENALLGLASVCSAAARSPVGCRDLPTITPG
jgi:mycothione reductase